MVWKPHGVLSTSMRVRWHLQWVLWYVGMLYAHSAIEHLILISWYCYQDLIVAIIFYTTLPTSIAILAGAFAALSVVSCLAVTVIVAVKIRRLTVRHDRTYQVVSTEIH
jgi:hypothetical protein